MFSTIDPIIDPMNIRNSPERINLAKEIRAQRTSERFHKALCPTSDTLGIWTENFQTICEIFGDDGISLCFDVTPDIKTLSSEVTSALSGYIDFQKLNIYSKGTIVSMINTLYAAIEPLSELELARKLYPDLIIKPDDEITADDIDNDNVMSLTIALEGKDSRQIKCIKTLGSLSQKK